MTQPSPTSKTCTKCGELKPLDRFGLEPRMRDGHKSWCRPCCALAVAERRARDPRRLARKAEEARRLAEGVKWCRGCESELPFDDFGASIESPDGRDPRCKDCNNRYMREFYARNLEERRAISRERSRKLRGSEARLEYERKWRAENRERLRANYRARHEANPTKEREKWLRRRARVVGATVGEVNVNLLWVRQCGLCALCGERIDADLAWPDPMSKSVDHIVPLALGGAHAQRNLQWAHLTCNIRKGARPPDAA